jgi:hypothetical protein
MPRLRFVDGALPPIFFPFNPALREIFLKKFIRVAI